MSRILGRLRRPDPVVFVIAALLCASTLVIFFHHRALSTLDRQTTVILQKVAEQTAAAVALEIRRTFDGPVFDTLASINHPQLVANRLDLVAKAYGAGLREYPQVDRFFAWTRATEGQVAGEAVFYGPRPPGATSDGMAPALAPFHRDPNLGRHIMEAARQHAGARQIYAAIAVRADGVPYQVFIRLFYTDAARDRYFAVLGFVVNLDHVRTRLFREIHTRQLRNLLEPKDGTPPFDLHVLDDADRLVYGPVREPAAIHARSAFTLQFYPVEDIRTRMAALVPARDWTVVISPRAQGSAVMTMMTSTRAQGYWLSGLSVLLMLVALYFAIQTRRRAAQLARMQADFVAHVSHQLKTPVSLLSAVSETVAMDRVRSPEKLAQCIAIIRGQTARLSALVERILDFSRVAGRRAFEKEPVELEPLVRETVDAFVAALERSGYHISVAGPATSPVVAADPAALEQALVNLLDNAIKYSGASQEIAVRIDASGGEAIIEVIDHGIGVQPADRCRIFDRFYRGEGAAVYRHGFGLGLPIANEIVNAHQGSIEVESNRDGGSTFRIRLPLLRGHGAVARRAGGWLRPRERTS
jgi:signal transduction histidine kinase